MELTGKCKLEFEKWLSNDSGLYGLVIETVTHYYGDDEIEFDNVFEELPASSKYGVYVDYFDSVGITCVIVKNANGFFIELNETLLITGAVLSFTRSEARTEAIVKANEIRNELLN